MPALPLDYKKIKFYRADAIECEFAVGGIAAGHYANGVGTSIIYWSGNGKTADVYLAKP